MPSDAYMEISDPNVWGETKDQYFGPDGPRNQGAFEIFNFEFSAGSKDDSSKDKGSNRTGTSSTSRGQHGQHNAGGLTSGQDATVDKQPEYPTFQIKKFIDKGSPDLLISCCKGGDSEKDKIDWAIISIRESGERKDKPYLVLEFRKLRVTAFSWSMAPGGDASSASQEESVTFSFETILIKYCRQDATGAHSKMKIKGFNWAHPELDVPEISWDALGLAVENN